MRSQCEPVTGAVLFQSNEDVISFVESVLTLETDVSSLQDLHFASGALSASAGRMITAFILRYSSDLQIEHLRIDDAEAVFASYPDLADVLATVKTIKHLSLHAIGSHARRMLCNLSSPLISADLSMVPFDDTDSVDVELLSALGEDDRGALSRSPIDLLRGSQETLEMLTGQGCETLCDAEGWYSSRSYPHVRLVDLKDNDIPITIHYAYAFPNLCNLSIETSHELLAGLGIIDWEGFFRVRKRNKVEQRQFGTWATIAWCRASLVDHFMLGLMCPVKTICVVGPYMDPNMLFHVLKTTRPSSLLLEGFSATDLCRGSLAKVLCGPYGVQLSEVQYHIMVLRTDTKVPEMLVCALQLMNVEPHMNGIAGCFN